MKILVAGGAGFIGSHLVERLVSRGDQVTVIDDLSSGLEDNLYLVKDKVTFVKADISGYETKENFNVIINLASRASRMEWETFPVGVALSNSIGNNNLIKIALNSGARYIFASTSEVYGNPEIVPTPETYIGRVSSVGSRSPYDESKRFGEALVKAYEREYKLDSIIIRFFNTYGPRMRGGDLYGRVLDRFIQQALYSKSLTVYGDGSQTRSFTHVSDTVTAILMLMSNGKSGEIYNVGNDREISIIELANLVKNVTGSSTEITFESLPPDDPKRRAADISKIEKLGWRPKVELSDGILTMVEYEMNDRKWEKRIIS